MVYSIMILVFGVILGFDVSKVYFNYINEKVIKETKDEINSVYKDVSNILRNGNSKFVDRLNNNVTIKMNIDGFGMVNIMYLMDKEDIALFVDEKCIFTSDMVDREIIENIVDTINILYNKEIEDNVNVMGIIYYRPEFERKFNVKVSDLKKNIGQPMPNEKSDIEKIIEDNNIKFDVDTILDKINYYGLDSLSKAEKKFLMNYNK